MAPKFPKKLNSIKSKIKKQSKKITNGINKKNTGLSTIKNTGLSTMKNTNLSSMKNNLKNTGLSSMKKITDLNNTGIQALVKTNTKSIQETINEKILPTLNSGNPTSIQASINKKLLPTFNLDNPLNNNSPDINNTISQRGKDSITMIKSEFDKLLLDINKTIAKSHLLSLIIANCFIRFVLFLSFINYKGKQFTEVRQHSIKSFFVSLVMIIILIYVELFINLKLDERSIFKKSIHLCIISLILLFDMMHPLIQIYEKKINNTNKHYTELLISSIAILILLPGIYYHFFLNENNADILQVCLYSFIILIFLILISLISFFIIRSNNTKMDKNIKNKFRDYLHTFFIFIVLILFLSIIALENNCIPKNLLPVNHL
jgi:hypothetical protein